MKCLLVVLCAVISVSLGRDWHGLRRHRTSTLFPEDYSSLPSSVSYSSCPCQCSPSDSLSYIERLSRPRLPSLSIRSLPSQLRQPRISYESPISYDTSPLSNSLNSIGAPLSGIGGPYGGGLAGSICGPLGSQISGQLSPGGLSGSIGGPLGGQLSGQIGCGGLGGSILGPLGGQISGQIGCGGLGNSILGTSLGTTYQLPQQESYQTVCPCLDHHL